MEYVSMHNFIRCASEQCICKYQIYFWTKNAVIMTFEDKKSINLISKSRCPILHALKIKKQYYKMTIAASGINTDVCVLYKPPIFVDKIY